MESEDKGYTVKDRRSQHMSEEEKANWREKEATAPPAEEGAESKEAEAETAQVPLPEITFSSFLFSLGTSAFLHLGAIPDPATGKVNKNFSLAKQTIDLIALLKEKTRNNLTSEEGNLLESLLYDLRMRYIQEAR